MQEIYVRKKKSNKILKAYKLSEEVIKKIRADRIIKITSDMINISGLESSQIGVIGKDYLIISTKEEDIFILTEKDSDFDEYVVCQRDGDFIDWISDYDEVKCLYPE